MNLLARIMALLVGINLIFSSPSSAKFAVAPTREVPISRLLRNLEYQRADAVVDIDKAMADFRIGRLHAMAYALDLDKAPCDASALRGSKYELPDFGRQGDHVQFPVGKQTGAKDHLKEAVKHMEAALKAEPSLNIARLGLGWCQEQSGDKAKALATYRDVFARTAESDKNSKGGMYRWSIAEETATYLAPLLDPVKDKKELEHIKSMVGQIAKLPHYVTPIMVPLQSGIALGDLLLDKKVRFDLDGFGAQDYAKWPAPNAGWLVFDQKRQGIIDSGIKLIGQSSFWIFWQNGFEVLRALDDNHDGKLSGHELDGIAIWCDRNSNGISEAGEVAPLAQFGIVELGVAGKKDSGGIMWNPRGVRFKNGVTLPSYDVVLPRCLSEKSTTRGGVLSAPVTESFLRRGRMQSAPTDGNGIQLVGADCLRPSPGASSLQRGRMQSAHSEQVFRQAPLLGTGPRPASRILMH